MTATAYRQPLSHQTPARWRTTALDVSRVRTGGDRLILLFTVGRLVLVPAIALAFGREQVVLAALLAVFIAADLYDGVLARRRFSDDVARRALDSVVDRLAIWPVLAVVSAAGYLSPYFVVAVVLRDIYSGYWCARMVTERQTAIRADWLYRALNLSLAVWVVAAQSLDSSWRVIGFSGVMLLGIVVAADLTRLARIVLARPMPSMPCVQSAGPLRRRGVELDAIPGVQ